MPDFPIEFRAKDYVTNQGLAARSVRPFVEIQCGTLQPLCFIDSGAPFCVVSYSVAKQISWHHLGTGLLLQGKPAPLDWQSVPCEYGETRAVLLDPASGLVSRALRLIGKFALAPHPSLEGYVLLGMNLLSDNGIDLVIRNQAGSFSGVLSVP